MNKTIPLSLAIIVVAVLFSLDCMAPTRQTVRSVIKNTLQRVNNYVHSNSQTSTQVPKVFSKEELSKYKGEGGGKVYLAIVGSVFDVSKGRRHYGPGGGYEFFAGIDGTKAFVSGDFDSKGLTDDISELSGSEIFGLNGWKSFYEKDYSFIGIVEGAFYNSKGEETDMMLLYRQKLELAQKEKELLENDRQLFPPCNTEWSQQDGGRVWCSNLSGGIQRKWAGVPRMYYTAGSSSPRCACVRTSGAPSHDLNRQNHKNNGDLDNPNLSLYPGCSPLSKACITKK